MTFTVKCPYCDHEETFQLSPEPEVYVTGAKPGIVHLGIAFLMTQPVDHECPSLKLVVER